MSEQSAPQVTVDAAAVRRLLDGVQILAPLSPELKERLARVVSPVKAAAGQVIMREGDPGDAMYLIGSGTVTIYTTEADLGVTVELTRMGAGASFGEIALITDRPRTASVAAITPCQLFALPRTVFYSLIKAAPEVALQIAAGLSDRLYEATRERRVLYGSLQGVRPDPALSQAMPPTMVRRLRMVPVQLSGNIVTVATPDPNNRVAIAEVRRIFRGYTIRMMAVTAEDYDAWVAANLGAERLSSAPGSRRKVEYPNLRGLEDRAATGAAPELLNELLLDAIDREATDVLIEPNRTGTNVRFRVDGRLVSRSGQVPTALHTTLVSRVKVLASLDITEKRLPQDGRFSLRVDGANYVVRVATVNTLYGEKLAFRMVDGGKVQGDLSQLILWPKALEAARRVFFQASGLALVTGPSGTGKTTTLYAAVSERNQSSVSICSVEDPIESEIDGATQVPLNESVGLSYPIVIRTFLRQGPDILLVGEMRDRESADLTANAALSGHFVLSSFHTNDAVTGLVRLQDMGVERFVLSSAVVGIINQRLVRRVCGACMRHERISEPVQHGLARAGVNLSSSTPLAVPVGCRSCGGQGFLGRVGIYEILEIGNELRESIAAGEGGANLLAAARSGGLLSLADYAGWLLGQGMTTASEVLRVLPLRED